MHLRPKRGPLDVQGARGRFELVAPLQYWPSPLRILPILQYAYSTLFRSCGLAISMPVPVPGQFEPHNQNDEDVWAHRQMAFRRIHPEFAGTYAVLGQRRARILREELREGSNLFTIHAFLPAEASFGFVDDMRRRSSGAASASLMLSHWERLQVSQFCHGMFMEGDQPLPSSSPILSHWERLLVS